ncbi:MAG: SH3 domain-containing protein [Chloroflexota bacterium]
MKRQLLIFPLVLLLATLACTINAPPGSAERSLLVADPVTPAVATATRQNIPTGAYPLAPSVTAEPRPTQARTCEVNTPALNVRSGPGLDYPAVSWLYAGDTVTVRPIPHPTAWLPVESGDGLAGWVKAEFCEVQP